MCKRIFKIQALMKQLLTKYQIFTILPQVSHFHKYRNFSSIFCNFLDQLLHPYKFHGRDMSGILFFILASCHPLICKLSFPVNIHSMVFNEVYYYSGALNCSKYGTTLQFLARTNIFSRKNQSKHFVPR